MNKLILAALAATAVGFTTPAFAQAKPGAAKVDAKPVDIPADFLKKQQPTQYLAKDRLIGQQVKNKDGQVIGDIEGM